MRSGRHVLLRTMVTVGMLCVLGIPALPVPTPAWAHANVLQAVPSPGSSLADPPTEVRLWFSEPADAAGTSLAVYNPRWARVDTGTLVPEDAQQYVAVLSPLAPGAYTAVWTSLSAAAGDEARGLFAFLVGALPPEAQFPATVTGSQTQDVGDLRIGLRPGPAGPAGRFVDVMLADLSGQPVGDPDGVERVELRLAPADRDVGVWAVSLGTTPVGVGTYQVSGPYLLAAGPWTVTVRVRRAEVVDDATASFVVEVGSAAVGMIDSGIEAQMDGAPAVP